MGMNELEVTKEYLQHYIQYCKSINLIDNKPKESVYSKLLLTL